MSVTFAWAGAQSPSGFRTVCKVTGAAVRLAVSDQVTFSGDDLVLVDPQFFDAEPPDAQGMASATATGLDVDTVWHWQIEEDSTLIGPVGRIRTLPAVGSQASFTFAASACAGSDSATDVSNHQVFDVLAGKSDGWLFFHHLGDLHYRDINTDDVSLYRQAYEDVLTSSRQANLYQSLGISYQWDDHDFGPNNSDRTSPGREAAAQAYREAVPHHPLVDDLQGIYQSWQVGRVLFISTDHRSFRDPNTDPDGPDKTMLGQAQLSWIDSTLAGTSAEVLVLFTEHYATSPDSWDLYQNEAEQLRQILEDRGFANRTVLVTGDIHQLAFDSGAGAANLFDVPTFMFASLDSSFGAGQDDFDLGIQPGRGQYGTVDVTDDGDSITLEATGWQMHDVWQTHTVTFSLTGEGGGTSTAESVATIRRTVTWLACDTISGGIIDELPAPQGGQISRVIGHATSTGLQFPTPELPPARWNQVTEPLRTMVVAVINDVPAWGGILLNPTDGSGELEGFALATPEVYLAHRYVGDLTFSGVDLSLIAAGLVDVAQAEGIGFTLDITLTGSTGDRNYAAAEGATVLERLSELMDVTNGPEFTADVEWANTDKTVVAKVLRIAPRLGKSTGPVFETKGEGNATYQRSRDWSDGRGANHVVATTLGEGDDRPTSDPARDETSIAVRGRWEHRFTPSTSIKRKATLNQHAQAELARRRSGTTVWSLSSNWKAYPRYGVDWRLGDSSTWNVHSDRHPNGIEGAGRIIGWKLDLSSMRVTPQFEED